MMAGKWPTRIVTACIVMAVLSLIVTWTSPMLTTASANTQAELSAALRVTTLIEPLLATKPTTPAEDLALDRALKDFLRGGQFHDVGDLEAFLSAYPESGWAAALRTNLGLIYLNSGRLSKALSNWQQAWALGKESPSEIAHPLIDRAVGELARLYARLGRTESLTELLQDVGRRPILGSATEAIQEGSDHLSAAKSSKHHLYTCGPAALRALIVTLRQQQGDIPFLRWYRAGPEGTNLGELARLAEKAGFAYRLVHREPGQPVPDQAVVHWKLDHFGTISGKINDRYLILDSVFPGGEVWVTQATLDVEASGYFLVPESVPDNNRWRPVDTAEARNVWGKGNTNTTTPGAAGDPLAKPEPQSDPNCGMCRYNIKESSVSLTLSDTPVGYVPPIGRSARTTIKYSHRDDSQPATFQFFNLSKKWTMNWISYVKHDPGNPSANVTRYLSGGGEYRYPFSGYDPNTGRFAAQFDDGSVLVRETPQGPTTTFRRELRDGSIEYYTEGALIGAQYWFLTRIVDPYGNSVVLSYDSPQANQPRLVSVTDATGRQTSFTYGLSGWPLQITKITDPFGREATLTYDNKTPPRLTSITDVIGIKSEFTYDDISNTLVSLKTPYGNTSFSYSLITTYSSPRYLQIMDPMDYSERVEWQEGETRPPVPESEPLTAVPDGPNATPPGMPHDPANGNLNFRNSAYWDKQAFIEAGCATPAGCDYRKARIRHFTHMSGPLGGPVKGTALESVKYPLENRIWYNYPGQPPSGQNAPTSSYGGSFNSPIAIGRKLDDGTTQVSRFAYDEAGTFNLTSATDPLGRETTMTYAANGIDLLTISQKTAPNVLTPVAQYTYNPQHRPLTYTDAAGQTTTFTYNPAGQLTSVTNPLSQTTTYQYNAQANLTAIFNNANNQPAATFTYDAFNRVATRTDSEGWTLAYSYDAADRVTQITYPDGTTDTYTYDRLDLGSYTDRQGRQWVYTHDANRRMTKVVDPAGQQTQFGYDRAGRLTSRTDPKGFVTGWAYDIQGRLTSKTYPNASTVTYTYEATTSRLKSITDALGQTKQFTYANDNRLLGTAYLNPVNPTPSVSLAYDPWFPRVTSRTVGAADITQYTYAPIGSLGAMRLLTETSPLANSAITYGYDALGRVTSRNVAGSAPEAFQYDPIGRLTSRTNDLGTFTLGYLGQTGQITSRQRAGSTVATTWSYLPNSGDRRLAGINNTGYVAGHFSNFTLATTPENFISNITETSNTTVVYPAAGTQTVTFNNLNQVTAASGQAFTYDANGNLLSDGQRVYTWDAEDRLIGITYPAQPGKASAFAYDGQGRRVAMTETPPTGGGSPITTRHVWCGARLCQARNEAGTLTRGYHAEGEFIPGGASLHYGIDQIGSVRRAFASTSNAPAYGYDPYGQSLQAGAPLTDFGYAGMFRHGPSGLYLTWFRAYDAGTGRWLSRDPLGEDSDPAGNLYPYVGGNPVGYIDPDGGNPALAAALAGGLLGGALGSGTLGGLAGNIAGAGAFAGIGALCYLGILCPPPQPPMPPDSGGYCPIPAGGLASMPPGPSSPGPGAGTKDPSAPADPADIARLPPGRYKQPNGGETDIGQQEDHGAGLNHTHNPIWNKNPKTGQSYINGLNKGDKVTNSDVDNILSGAAPRAPAKGRR